MEVLISGLNSYLGRAAVTLLAEGDFKVTALTRNLQLLQSVVLDTITARVKEVDLLRKGKSFDSFYMPVMDYAYYFTQVVDLSDEIHLRMELISLNHFVELVKRNNCKRIIYIARLKDADLLSPIIDLFLKNEIDYTIVLKSSAIGNGTLMDQFYKMISEKPVIIYDAEIADKEFSPLSLRDLIRWLREMPWKDHFIGKTITIGGDKVFTYRKLFFFYAKYLQVKTSRARIALPQTLTKVAYKNIYRMSAESYDEFLKVMLAEFPVDNSDWNRVLDFKFTPLREVLQQG